MSGTPFVDEAGADGPALVFVHGFAGTHRVWDAVRAELGPAARTLAYDLPGHGASLAVPGAGAARASGDLLLADLERRGVGRFHLVGHSFGGAVAMLMALAAPRRVASLTLLAPGGFGPRINGALLARFGVAADMAQMRACLAAMRGAAAPPPPEEAVAEALALRDRPGQRRMFTDIAAALAPDGRQGTIPRAGLESLAMPVDVVWGTDDAMLPFDQTRDLPADFAVHGLEGHGHMLPEEAPRAVAALLSRRLAADGPGPFTNGC